MLLRLGLVTLIMGSQMTGSRQSIPSSERCFFSILTTFCVLEICRSKMKISD